MNAVPAEVYSSVQQFYARQIQLLGDGDVERWSQTFTEDALFEQATVPGREFARGAAGERRGRNQIAAAARGAVAQRREEGKVRRYWLGMLTVTPADGSSVRTDYYAALVQTDRDGAGLHLSTTGSDVLVRSGESWQVAYRLNAHDDSALLARSSR